ncbi:ABC transporter permease [Deminuibacter soli]|uniref:ABC transporter permease n=1 Tax=Deminuibacter soli TaxID=2291815 RepID=A0A3E1NER4_9BACT|nr:ABC transporter permease [Deminuibacter soli]RFM26291.1 ABC transporter permease [Deminuibacter soli]
MFFNFFKTAWRNLVKNKFYSTINIAGLAIGLAVGIMILLWVQDEFSYDRFHANAGHMYKLNAHLGEGAAEQVWSPPAPMSVFAKQIPEVEKVVRVMGRDEQLVINCNGKKFVEKNAAFADSNFFRFFSFRLLKGNIAVPFSDINSVILSQTEARKLFGTEDATGKTLQISKENFVVSGIMADFPASSSMHYSILFPMTYYGRQFTASGGNMNWKTIDEDLGDYGFEVYLQLKPNTNTAAVGDKLSKIFWQHRNETFGTRFTLQPFTSIHLVASDGSTGALQITRIFLIVAILILVIACINYVNLSTARSMLRAKEVSMRKIIGAARKQLFLQFIVESALLFMLASLLAFGIIYLLMPFYNDLSGKQLHFSLSDSGIWLVVGCAITGTLMLSSVYPALLLSSFKPMQAMRGKIIAGIGNVAFRKTLVVTQFVFSVGLIISTIVIGGQLKYIRDKDLGFDKEQVFSFFLDDKMYMHSEAIREQLAKNAEVLSVAGSDNTMSNTQGMTTGDTDWEGKNPNTSMLVHVNRIDEHFIPLLKLKLAAGHNFAGDKADSMHFIVNEAAVRQMGLKDPIGKRFQLWQTKGIIVGVTKDFNYSSLKKQVEPVVFTYKTRLVAVNVKTTAKGAAAAVDAARSIWNSYGSEYPFNYTFLDADFDAMYRTDQRTGKLFNLFALVAVVISCLGLFGLATYTAQVKTKEMGIRKTLGATVVQLTTLLAKDFVQLVLLAFVIASPLAWVGMHYWLQNYSYRIGIGWWIFALAGFMMIAIALITVGYQAIRTASANPVKSLKAE